MYNMERILRKETLKGCWNCLQIVSVKGLTDTEILYNATGVITGGIVLAKKKQKRDNTYGSGLEKELDSIMGTDVKIKNENTQKNQQKKKTPVKSGKKKKKRGSNVKYAVIGCAVVAVVAAGALGGTYVYKAQEYKDVFFPNTTINSIDCSKKTVEEVEEIIRSNVEDYALSVKFRDGESLVINGAEIEYKYNKNNDISDLLRSQNIMSWYQESQKPKEYTVNSSTSFDEDKLTQIISECDELQPIHQTAPKDAYMDYKDGKFVIEKEDPGNSLDEQALIAAVVEAVSSGVTELNVEETGVYAQPAVTSEDEKMMKTVQQLNQYVGASITYILPQGNKVLDGTTMIEWLDKDEDGNYTRDDEAFNEKLKEFVTELAKETDTLGGTMDFKSTYGTVVSVKTVDVGWKIDQTKELETLKSNIENGDCLEREPEYKSRMASAENGGFGNTYIEVDLTSQHVYFYKEGKVVWSSDCVSGKMTKDRYTPSGVYLLDYKTKDRDLKGEKLPNGEYSYVSHVDYWMPFYGGYGFHDASWRSRFGGSIYNYSGSHGCINLPKSKAATLYDLIDKEVPIVIFYRHDFTLRPAEPKMTNDGEGTASSSKSESSSKEESSSKKEESSSKKEESSSKKEESSSKQEPSSSTDNSSGGSSGGSSSSAETPPENSSSSENTSGDADISTGEETTE